MENPKREQKLSVVIPLHNEEGTIGATVPAVHEAASALGFGSLEIIAIDDGSTDKTRANLFGLEKQYGELSIVSFNRNFGKEAAIHAGLRLSTGDAVVVMDGDGQHPPALLPEMTDLWDAGAKVVTAYKKDRGKESLSSKFLAACFYKLFFLFTDLDIKNLSDYMLLDRSVVDAYCELPERKRFFRGMVTWMGFTTSKVFFDVPERVTGGSSWGRVGLLRFGSAAISAFTSSPLHLISIFAVLYSLFAILIGGIALYDKIMGQAVTGFATVILVLVVTGALIMFGLGQLGIYIEQIFEELKHRPDYVIDDDNSLIKK